MLSLGQRVLLWRLSMIGLVPLVAVVVTVSIAANAQVSLGEELTSLQMEETSLREEVQDLRRQTADLSSLTRIQRQAQDGLKMEPIGNRARYVPLIQEAQP